MGIELPAELADVAAKAGVSWPQADEDKLRASATAWREAGAKLSTLAGESDGSAGKALAALTGSTGDAARGHWNKFTAPDGTLNAVLRGCRAAADRLDHAAEQVGAAKVELVRELVNLAKNNDAAQQAANAGHPTALLGLETAVRGAAANVAHLTTTLTSAVRLDSGVLVGGHQPPVDANPGAHAPGDAGPGHGGGSGQPQGGNPPGGGHGGGGQGSGGQGGGLLGGLLPGGGQGGGPLGGLLPGGSPVGGLVPGGGQGGGPLPGLVDPLMPGRSEGTVPAPAGAGSGPAPGGSGAAPGSGHAPGLVGGLLGAVTDTVGAVTEPVLDVVEKVAPPVAAVVEPALDRTGEAVRHVGGVVDDTVGRTVQGAVHGVSDTVHPGHDNAPGRSGSAPGLGNLVDSVVAPVAGAANPVVDAVTRTEGTVHQSSAAVLDRPLLPQAEAPHAPAQPAPPAANQAGPQGPSFSGPSVGGGAPAAPAAAAAAAVTQSPAANATNQAPGQQSGAQAAPKAEARAAQPGQTQSGQTQPGQGQSQGQGQAQSQGQSAQNQNQGQGAQGKGEAAAKADAQPKGEVQAKAEVKDVRQEVKDALETVGQRVENGDLAFAIVPIPVGGRDTIAPPLQPGATAAVLPAEPADDTPPAPPVRAAQDAQPSTEAAAVFLLHMFPGGTLPPPSARPARQLPPPSADETFAAGLRFEPQGHPDGDLVDASAQYGLDLRAVSQDAMRSRLSGAEPTAPASTDPVPAVNRPRLVLMPGTAPDPVLLAGYDPLAGMHERDWDRRFLVRADPPEYAWPPGELFPEGGYEAGQPGVLAVGVELDRFGGPEGRVLSERGTPYAERSLPPALVDAGYHRYRVAKVLPVWFTLSAEWFGQPGGGARFRATYPVADLVALGYLEEVA
ncbi:TNT domain-containing protein [Saccharothrix saharensis]|uniref:TNT domain-containing protein n=1 Tax=Saccharothrix saharensis TaxID=571190 RepID=UPI0036C7154A